MAIIQARKRPDNLKATLKRFISYLGHHKCLMLLVGILVILSSGANLLGTFMFQPIIDSITSTSGLSEVYKMIALEIIIYSVGVLSTLGYSQIMARLAQKVIYEMRMDMFSRMESLPLAYFDRRTHGEIMSLYINDIDSVSEAINNAFALLISNFIHIVGLMIIIFILNWLLSLICLVFYAIMFSYLIYASKRSKAAYAKSSKVMANVNGFVEEMISGQKVVQVFNHEDENLIEFEKRSNEFKKSSYEAMRYSFSLIPMVVSIGYINYAVVAIVGGLIALDYISIIDISLGSISAFLVLVRQGTMPINQFTNQANILLNGLAGAERIFKLMDEISEVDDGNVTLIEDQKGDYYWCDNKELVPLNGDVRFFNVDFSYYSGKRILENLSLYAKPGQKIAFVGSTGAGKTTITNLINRFYEIEGGTITIDGIDARRIKKADLRNSLGIVLQDTHLFTGTIMDNIRYGNLKATDEEIKEAAKLANAHGFIKRLPDGYNTMIYSDGSNLSSGQRQLLSIARAAVSKRPILILDEATSVVDTRTEALVEAGMDSLMEGKTGFVIAHRLSTVRNSNAIMVLDHGHIIERGDHDDLIKAKGVYYNLATGSLELE